MGIQCTICGGSLTMNGNNKAVCDQCGMQYSMDSLRKQAENTAVPSRTSSPQVNETVNLLRLAKTALSSKKYQEVERICQQILSSDYKNKDAWELRISAISHSPNISEFVNYVQEYTNILATPSQQQEAKKHISNSINNLLLGYYDYLESAAQLKRLYPELAEKMACRLIDSCIECTDSYHQEIQQGLKKERDHRPSETSASNAEFLSVRNSIGVWHRHLEQFYEKLERITPLCRLTGTQKLQLLCDKVDKLLKELSTAKEWNGTFKTYDYVSGMKFPRYTHSLELVYPNMKSSFKDLYEGVKKSNTFISRNLSRFEAEYEKALKLKMDKYWQEHPQEHTQLLEEKKHLEQKLSDLKKKANIESYAAQRSELQKKISLLEFDLSKAGAFAFKAKKNLRYSIENLNKELQSVNASESCAREKLEKECKPALDRLQQITKTLSGK